MAKFMTTKEASEKWGVSERRINTFCKEGRIPGAYKDKENKNKQWMIPADAVKPAEVNAKPNNEAAKPAADAQQNVAAEQQ